MSECKKYLANCLLKFEQKIKKCHVFATVTKKFELTGKLEIQSNY
jgi:hypothetical protein